MVIVFIEHFLSQKGVNYLNKWIREAEIEMQKFNGFKSINRAVDVQDKSRTILILKFESEPLLGNWSTSLEHKIMLEKLSPFMTTKQKSQILEIL